jgi:hypothetical protein
MILTATNTTTKLVRFHGRCVCWCERKKYGFGATSDDCVKSNTVRSVIGNNNPVTWEQLIQDKFGVTRDSYIYIEKCPELKKMKQVDILIRCPDSHSFARIRIR